MQIKEVKLKKNTYFQCDICKLLYKEKIWAEKCSVWCAKNKSCNLEITRHAIKINLKK